MATPSNHWKLGLFVVCCIAVGLAALILLGAHGLNRPTVTYRSYFDESVQGLEIGAPVKFRGVTIGSVAEIGVAPDRRHVMVTSNLGVDQARTMGLAGSESDAPRVPVDLRVQLASAGITGVKFIQIDFFSPITNPVPKLPFEAPKNYIPAAVSTMKNLEDAVVLAVSRFPEMTNAAMALIDKLDRLVDDVDRTRLPERTLSTLAAAQQAFAELKTTLTRTEVGKLSEHARSTLGRADELIARVDKLVAKIDGDRGVVMSAQRASDAIGDVAQNAGGLTEDLGATLRDVQQAAEAVQKLADALERDPDMLLKGRARRAP
ncbi:MAG TPA: MlaD family protein [Polyangiaceae bacterium]|nr:MlaD family protein [Polyangiaceae bacterium]